MDFIQEQRAREMAEWEIKLQAVTTQLSFTNDLVQRRNLENERAWIETELQKARQAFAQTRQTSRQRDLDWNDCLHRLDFSEVRAMADAERKRFTRQHLGAASFFFQHGYEMGGEWCVKLLRDVFKAAGSPLPAYRIEF